MSYFSSSENCFKQMTIAHQIPQQILFICECRHTSYCSNRRQFCVSCRWFGPHIVTCIDHSANASARDSIIATP